jgi:hypothetical protein
MTEFDGSPTISVCRITSSMEERERERERYFRSGIPFWRIKTVLKDIDESITGGNSFLFHVKREQKLVKQPVKISERY